MNPAGICRVLLILFFFGFGVGRCEVPRDTKNEAQILVWDATEKRYEAKLEETKHEFSFAVTNSGSQEIVITDVNPSCACTVAPLPESPWKLAPGAKSALKVVVDFSGKSGGLMKMIEVKSSAGSQILYVVVTIPPGTVAMGNSDLRQQNREIALADRQAVFRNNCATCHSEKVTPETRSGVSIYAAACMICHEAAHRASMVPDLSAIQKPRDEEYWRKWISEGGNNTLMPAFAKTQGGPLDDEQINSLITYLRARYPDQK